MYPECTQTLPYEEIRPPEFSPTPEQNVIFDWALNGEGHAIIDAVAGSGKTTTLLQLLYKLPVTQRALYVAFNAAVKAEFKNKAPAHVSVETFHSWGLKLIRHKLGGMEIDEEQRGMMNALEHSLDKARYRKYARKIMRVYEILRNNLMPIDAESLQEVIMQHAMDFDDVCYSEILTSLLNLETANSVLLDAGVLTFSDMIHIPATRPEVCDKGWDWILVDESQDLNVAQIAMLMNNIGPQTRVVCVGDPYQAIYGFRGADTEAINNLRERLSAKVLPLTVCFRCPTRHIELAQAIVPHIQAADWAKAGVITDWSRWDFTSRARRSDLIISRLNAPLVPLAFDLIRAGKPAAIRGRDLAKQIISRLEACSDMTLERAEEVITRRIQKQQDKLIEKNNIAAANRLDDLLQCILHFIDLDTTNSVSETVVAVRSLFDESQGKIILSSIHRAKGLEAERVAIVDYDMMPLKLPMEWQMAQEMNLIYVALTRSKRVLAFLRTK
jgi:DNA helicase-2/ATP-dependent DNA helicase PcrA